MRLHKNRTIMHNYKARWSLYSYRGLRAYCWIDIANSTGRGHYSYSVYNYVYFYADA
jgi:hypothetical protein